MTSIIVVHVVTDLRQEAGGIANVVPAMAARLSECGVDSHFITYHCDPDFSFLENTTECPALLQWTPWRLIDFFLDAIGRLTSKSHVIVHSHGIWDLLNNAGLRAANRLKLPTVISLHGMLLPWARQNHWLRKEIAWHAYQKTDLLFANRLHVTSQAERMVVSRYVSKAHIVDLAFGVDVPECTNASDRPMRRLLYLGRLHRIKNLEALIRAFCDAASEEWTLRLVGPDSDGYRLTLEQLTAELGMEQRIIFNGPVFGEDKEQEIRAAAALVLPSFSENFGVVVAEALAMGRPVITSEGTPWQIVQVERCGWWVKPDQFSLASAIRELVKTSISELDEMGLRGRTLVEAQFSWVYVCEQMIALYTSLLTE